MEFVVGAIAKSLAGNDRGKNFVVTDISDDFAYISDGKKRKLETPKKKRIKHLKFTNTVIELSDYTDKKLREYLREYTESREDKTKIKTPE